MSFDKQNATVEEGDTIVLYMGRQPVSLEINVTKTLQTKFGAFPHRTFVGKKYGSKVYSSRGKGWVYILHPTPELWTVTLPHRTQILYSMDISMITFELELRPGSVVVEAGTGSGSLSHAIIRTIKPNGHLFTFDFHQNRVIKAKEEFDKHYGTDKYVTSTCADVCANGFSITDQADAVFLDLPAPWDAIPHAKIALRKSGGRLCSFSPCIEQVQRSCDSLRKAHFCEIKTIECLVRPMNVTTTPIPEMVFDFDASQLETEEETKIKKIKIENNIAPGERLNGDADCHKDTTESLKDNTNESEVDSVADPAEIHADKIVSDSTKISADKESNVENITGLNSYGMVTKLTAKSKKGNINVLTCKPSKEVTGHTGYLTFASLYPFELEGNV